jgi:hypothetical protein
MLSDKVINTGYEPKNKIVPQVIKGFFTAEEIEALLAIVKYQKKAKYLDEFYSAFVLLSIARMQIEVMYPKTIQEKLEDFASKIVGEEVFMYRNSWFSYNKKHNINANPKFPVRYDLDNYFSKLTMYFQLYTNIDWPIVIEDKSFSLEYGDLLIFWGAGQAHWREPVLFKEGDHTEILTMHFSTKKDFEDLDFVTKSLELKKEKIKKWNLDPVFLQHKENFTKKEESLKKKSEAYKELLDGIKNAKRKHNN